MKILTYGSLNLDYVYQVQHFVQPGETLSSQRLDIHCGGKGLNQSIAMAKAGGQVFHAGAVGSDGGALRCALEKSGVDTRNLLTLTEVPTGHAIIQVDETGQNCILLFGGANRQIPEEHREQVLESFGKGDYLVLQNEVNGNGDILRLAHEKGMTVVLNPSPMDNAVRTLPLECVDWFMVNEGEMKALCGGGPEALLEKYPNANIVLTLGGRGSVCFAGGQKYTQGVFQVQAVDTTAAGDTFSGFFIAALSRGKQIPEALELASAAAAIAVSRPGAMDSIPTLEEAEHHSMTYFPLALT